MDENLQFGLPHRDRREDFADDASFANFRGLILQNCESRSFFRSASLFDDTYGRAETVDRLAKERGIKTVLNLGEILNVFPYGETLLEADSVINVKIEPEDTYLSWRLRTEITAGLKELLGRPGPYLIQCRAGKKRTGVACMLLELLSETSEDKVLEDYMKSYENNNGLEKGGDLYHNFLETRAKNMLVHFRPAEGCLKNYGMSARKVGKLKQRLKNGG